MVIWVVVEPLRRRRFVLALALGGALSGGFGCTSLAGIDEGVLVSDSGSDSTPPTEGGADARADGGNGDADAAIGPDAPGDTSTGEGGTGEGGEAGGTLSCAFALGYQRMVNTDGGTIAADNLHVYNTSQTNVLALVDTSNPPALAYAFRSDRPTDAVGLVPLQNPSTSSPAKFLSSARSVGGTATYVLASDQQGNALLWDWLDSSGIGAAPTSASESPSFDVATMGATTQGLFYGIGSGPNTYVDFEVPPTLPVTTASNVITTTDQGLEDGQKVYRLSDDSVSLLFFTPDTTMHQNHYAANSTTLLSTRQYFPGSMIPFSFLADGANVDVAAVFATSDAGMLGLFTGAIPETQFFTFDPATDLHQVVLPVPLTAQGCSAAYPGKVIALLPTSAGMDLYVIDVATGTVSYSLVGAANLLHSDSAIVDCAMATASITANVLSFEVIWTENTGGGPQNLVFAPLQCTLQ